MVNYIIVTGDASYLECQDFWRVSGIERDVFLYARPKVHIYHIRIVSVLDKLYKDGILSFEGELKSTADGSFKDYSCVVTLRDVAGKEILTEARTFPAVDSKHPISTIRIDGRVPSVRQWSAEIPNLYSFDIILRDEEGAVQEAISKNIGFRTVEVKGADFLVNGKRVFIKGVNRHEHDPETIHVLSREQMENDLRLMAVCLKAVISQRLVKAMDGTQVAAVEVLLNSKHIQELVVKNDIDQIKEAIEKSLSPGSVSFEQALFKLYADGKITKDEALRNSDSATNLAWLMNNAEQNAQRIGAKGPVPSAAVMNTSFDDFKIDNNAGN